ncbi:unnamed protein product [Vicia faba]|uniref:Uncharacterized protein n=1 Tax=Vicia faba TaxID=3906 RepID=A0AAV0Z3A1_VICFA|nr:unnamed protein product [Vicia faba]
MVLPSSKTQRRERRVQDHHRRSSTGALLEDFVYVPPFPTLGSFLRIIAPGGRKTPNFKAASARAEFGLQDRFLLNAEVQFLVFNNKQTAMCCIMSMNYSEVSSYFCKETGLVLCIGAGLNQFCSRWGLFNFPFGISLEVHLDFD